MKKRCLSGFLLLCLLFLISGCHTKEEPVNTGSFHGVFREKGFQTKVDVVLEEKRITHIEILEHNETPGFEKAMTQLIDDIIAKDSLEVDTITGATQTSKRFLAAVTDGLLSSGLSPDELLPPLPPEEAGENKTQLESCDILIIGAGGAGLSAAIEARSEGDDSVIVLEKMPFCGGNTRMSGGEYAAPGNWIQERLGIKDSEELLFQDVYESGQHKGNPDLIRIIAHNTLPNAYWLRDFVGVEYREVQSNYGGHSVSRTLWPVGDGPQYVDTLLDKAVSLGAAFHYNTRAERFIVDESGRITGVYARRGGKTIEYHANKGVILATGGFGANVAMRMQYDTRWHCLDARIPTTNSPASTGDGILMSEAIGANLVGMGEIQLYPINNPATGNYYFLDYARLNSNALLLNKEGVRFVDEKNTRDLLSEAILGQTGAKAYELIDARVVQEMQLETLYEGEITKCSEQGVLVEGSLAECCDYFDLPLEAVQATIDRFNTFAKSGADTDFGRTKNLEQVEGPTYYMFSCIASVHHTMGGVEIDTEARVLDTDGMPIPGLYAAGEVTGGIHGANRLGSMSMPDTVAFGRIAAQSAREQK